MQTGSQTVRRSLFHLETPFLMLRVPHQAYDIKIIGCHFSLTISTSYRSESHRSFKWYPKNQKSPFAACMFGLLKKTKRFNSVNVQDIPQIFYNSQHNKIYGTGKSHQAKTLLLNQFIFYCIFLSKPS